MKLKACQGYFTLLNFFTLKKPNVLHKIESQLEGILNLLPKLEPILVRRFPPILPRTSTDLLHSWHLFNEKFVLKILHLVLIPIIFTEDLFRFTIAICFGRFSFLFELINRFSQVRIFHVGP